MLEIEIIGPENGKSSYLYSIVQTAILELHIKASLKKSGNLDQDYRSENIYFPVLIINDDVCVSGRVPTVKETKEILLKASQNAEGKTTSAEPI
jgi:hypothetical protein